MIAIEILGTSTLLSDPVPTKDTCVVEVLKQDESLSNAWTN